APKPGQDKIMGLPAADFCKGFNALLADSNGELTVVSRLFKEDTFSPTLESPGARGLTDAVIGALSYTGTEFARSYDLPVNINADSRIRLASVDEKAEVRGLNSPGADRDSLEGLRVRGVATNLVVSPKQGQPNVLG